jgi:hypothetical protein
MGLDPMEVEHLRLAGEKGLGFVDLNEIEVVGESIEDVATVFERPSTYRD